MSRKSPNTSKLPDVIPEVDGARGSGVRFRNLRGSESNNSTGMASSSASSTSSSCPSPSVAQAKRKGVPPALLTPSKGKGKPKRRPLNQDDHSVEEDYDEWEPVHIFEKSENDGDYEEDPPSARKPFKLSTAVPLKSCLKHSVAKAEESTKALGLPPLQEKCHFCHHKPKNIANYRKHLLQGGESHNAHLVPFINFNQVTCNICNIKCPAFSGLFQHVVKCFKNKSEDQLQLAPLRTVRGESGKLLFSRYVRTKLIPGIPKKVRIMRSGFKAIHATSYLGSPTPPSLNKNYLLRGGRGLPQVNELEESESVKASKEQTQKYLLKEVRIVLKDCVIGSTKRIPPFQPQLLSSQTPPTTTNSYYLRGGRGLGEAEVRPGACKVQKSEASQDETKNFTPLKELRIVLEDCGVTMKSKLPSQPAIKIGLKRKRVAKEEVAKESKESDEIPRKSKRSLQTRAQHPLSTDSTLSRAVKTVEGGARIRMELESIENGVQFPSRVCDKNNKRIYEHTILISPNTYVKITKRIPIVKIHDLALGK